MSTLKKAMHALHADIALQLRIMAAAYDELVFQVECHAPHCGGEESEDSWWSVRVSQLLDAADQEQLTAAIETLDRLGLIQWNADRSCVRILELQP